MIWKKSLVIGSFAGLILSSLLAGWWLPGRKAGDRSSGSDVYWSAPDTSLIPSDSLGNLIRYGRNLIANTAYYLGPEGIVAQQTNGMNCQNCHLEAGTKFWGNNYGGVFSTYPKKRARSGEVESVYRRINDCIQRSLNGRALDSNSHEMQAIYSYMKWLGQNIPRGVKPIGTGIKPVQFLNRPADPEKGRAEFERICARCHGPEGQGEWNSDSMSYTYPPLWGPHSYNTGAGLYRLSRFAGYVKYNMPFGADYHNQQISTEEAWDIAAFVNSQNRPDGNFPGDWPDISKKPYDHPFGPYSDSFSEKQHKYGPFAPIQNNLSK